MQAGEVTTTLLGLFGGLAIFVYGMNLMGEGLQKSAGEKLRRIVEIFTSNPIMGIIVGALVTAIMQSSSATTVMVVGFVGAGLMTLPQSIGVIMGANIGTTMTAWLVSIKIGHYALPIAALGFILFFFPKSKKIKYIGQVIFAFGLLFVGLNTMSDLMKPLAKTPMVEQLIINMSGNKGLGLLVGTVVTAIIQSSSAAIAVLQKLASQVNPDGKALISLEAAMPILFGSNIGTTITAILASIGASINAKRAALAHTIFNVLGSLIFIWFIPIIKKLVAILMFGNLGADTMATQIAYSHTIFNLINTIIWIPFVWLLAKIVTYIYPGKEDITEKSLVYINNKVLNTPAIAMDLAVKELVRMAKIVQEMIKSARKSFVDNSTEDVERVRKIEDTVDMLQLEIVNYLSKMLSQSALTEKQSLRLAGLMHVTHDIEKIGDYCMNISGFAESRIQNKFVFSENAIHEVDDTFNFIDRIMDHATKAMENEDIKSAQKVLLEENEIDSLESNLRATHLDRLNKGLCHPDTAITFIELIHNLERIGDNCKNIAEAVLADHESEKDIAAAL